VIQKNSSILAKVFFLAILEVVVGLMYFILVGNLNSQVEDNNYSIEIIKRNSIGINKTAYFTERVLNKDNSIKEDANNSIIVIDFSYTAMKNGGFPPKTKVKRLLQPAFDENLEQIENTIKLWAKLKNSFLQIINEPLINHITTRKDTIVNDVSRKILSTSVILNPTVTRAKDYVENNIDILIVANENLIKFYVEENNWLQLLKQIFLVGLIGLNVLAFVFIYLFAKRSILNPIQKATNNLSGLLEGKSDIEKQEHESALWPINGIITKLSEKLFRVSEFASHLEKGSLDVEFQTINSDDKLENALTGLRSKLQNTKEIERKRVEEDTLRKWAIEGHTKFNDIMRKSSANLPLLADTVIKNIVIFLKASQGGIFVVNKNNANNAYLEQLSTFAYDRKKFVQKRIEIGEGLIGQCALERNTIFLSTIPENYLEIESGLGNAVPKSLILVPLKTEEDLLGVIEIASFNTMNQYEVDFLEEFGQSLAATFNTTKTSEETAKLLEQSQMKSDELAVNHASMRKEIEELQYENEQSQIKETEILGVLSGVNKAMMKAEFSLDGKFLSANRLYLTTLGFHFEELTQLRIGDFLPQLEMDTETLLSKIKRYETVQLSYEQQTKYGNKIWLLSQYTPVFDDDKRLVKILYLGNDVSKQKEEELNTRQLLDEAVLKLSKNIENNSQVHEDKVKLELEKTEILTLFEESKQLWNSVEQLILKAEYSAKGNLIDANSKFKNKLSSFFDDDETLTARSIVGKEDLESFEKNWANLFDNKSFSGLMKIIKPNASELWVDYSYSPVLNADESLKKVLFVATDVSEAKLNKNALLNYKQEVYNSTNKLSQKNILLNKEIDKYKSIFTNKLESESKVDKSYGAWIDNLDL